MSAFWSRIGVALVLLPLVLGLVWLGGWWLFALAAVGGLIALHELYIMGRGLRPIVLGGCAFGNMPLCCSSIHAKWGRPPLAKKPSLKS